MPQNILKRLFGKLDRKRLIVAAIVASAGLVGWRLVREKPRPVEDAEWDSIVFPEMAGSSVSEIEPPPVSVPPQAPREVAPEAQPDSHGLQIEVAANAALHLDDEWRPASNPVPRLPGVSLMSEPTRLEGGIEPIDAPAN
jgi:hypothetical protein